MIEVLYVLITSINGRKKTMIEFKNIVPLYALRSNSFIIYV